MKKLKVIFIQFFCGLSLQIAGKWHKTAYEIVWRHSNDGFAWVWGPKTWVFVYEYCDMIEKEPLIEWILFKFSSFIPREGEMHWLWMFLAAGSPILLYSVLHLVQCYMWFEPLYCLESFGATAVTGLSFRDQKVGFYVQALKWK